MLDLVGDDDVLSPCGLQEDLVELPPNILSDGLGVGLHIK
mgnify:CR=1 FL=1